MWEGREGSHSLHLLRFKYHSSHQTHTKLQVTGPPWYLNFIALKPNVPIHNQHLLPDPTWPKQPGFFFLFLCSDEHYMHLTQFCPLLSYVTVCTKFLLPDSQPSLLSFFSFKILPWLWSLLLDLCLF